MALRSRRLQVLDLEVNRPALHISPVFPRGIRFALCRFRSPLITASRLISFPAGTKMFQFPACPFLTECSEEQEVPFGGPWIKGSLRLPRAYRCLARPSSAPEPSHPPDGVATTQTTQRTSRLRMTDSHCPQGSVLPRRVFALPGAPNHVFYLTET